MKNANSIFEFAFMGIQIKNLLSILKSYANSGGDRDFAVIWYRWYHGIVVMGNTQRGHAPKMTAVFFMADCT
jgi:hypothetical protein